MAVFTTPCYCDICGESFLKGETAYFETDMESLICDPCFPNLFTTVTIQ